MFLSLLVLNPRSRAVQPRSERLPRAAPHPFSAAFPSTDTESEAGWSGAGSSSASSTGAESDPADRSRSGLIVQSGHQPDWSVPATTTIWPLTPVTFHERSTIQR
jgi:hypothetical protein